MTLRAFPVGARIWVEVIAPIDSMQKRAEAINLKLATFEHNKPYPTTGKVVALGKDPLVLETVRMGDTVFFSRHAGHEIQLEGRTLRSLELQEVTAVLREEANSDDSPSSQ